MHEHQHLTDDYHWPWLDESKQLSAKNANKFLLGARIDYQVSANYAWESARILTEIIMRDPKDLWGAIKMMKLQELKEEFCGMCHNNGCKRCAEGHELIKPKDSDIMRHKTLHRFKNQAAEKVWKLAHNILEYHSGDARNIWRNKEPIAIMERLADVGFRFEQSNMIVGALIDTGHITGKSKMYASINVHRVLGRVFVGGDVLPDEAHRLADDIELGNAWKIDGVLYALGQKVCKNKNPHCQECFLKPKCKYYNDNST